MQHPFPSTPYAVFTTAEARAAGWTRSALAHAVARQSVIRLHRGVFVAAAGWDGEGSEAERRRARARATAAVRAVAPSAASHVSAALLAGLPTWRLPQRPCVTVAPRYTGDGTDMHLHRATVTGHVLLRSDPPRLSTARTIVDIAREHGIEDAVVVGDCALRRGMADADRLARVVACCAGWPGIRRARHTLGLLDERSESPLESVSRIRLAYAGLPAPDLQPDIVDLNGVFLGRPDVYWDEYGVAGEVDGRIKYRDRPDEVFWAEKRRQEPMEDTGLVFVRWGRQDLDDMPRLTARLEAAFARGARRPRSERGWVALPLPRQYTPFC